MANTNWFRDLVRSSTGNTITITRDQAEALVKIDEEKDQKMQRIEFELDNLRVAWAAARVALSRAQ